MAARYSRRYANRLLQAYIDEIEEVREKVEKDFAEKDFENASARDDMEDCVRRIRSECNYLIAQIQIQML